MKQLVRIIDDDAGVRESLAAILEMEGYEVQRWDDPIKFLKEDSPDVPGCILLDVMMPGMSGYEVQKTLVERAQFLPIIFISAHGDIESVVSTMKLGASDFLQKPLDPERVIKSVADALKDQTVAARHGMSPNEAFRRFNTLTDREKQILWAAYAGHPNSAIAMKLSISLRTVENHRANAYRKMQCANGKELNSIMKAVKVMLKELEEKGEGKGW